MKYRCPVCKRNVEASPRGQPEEENFFPFCSRRCKLIDLGAWLDAEYNITSELQSEDSKKPAGASGADDTGVS